MGQAQSSTLRIDPRFCNGCGRCVDVCPVGALALVDGRVSLVRPQTCTDTALCELACPTGAIQLPMQVVGAAAT
jgi:NAD-dependent dihydropyrimidine dehydrogenase PreA subunit